MNINNIISEVEYGSDIARSSYNPTIMANMPYINNDTGSMNMDVAILYNIVYDKEYGSSSQYTVPTYLDNTSSIYGDKRDRGNSNRNEKFDNLETSLDIFEILMTFSLIIFILLFISPFISPL
jgi:hypothetical protein